MNDTIPTISRPRKRLRLTLGGMMLLIVLFSVWLGWIVHRAKVQREAVAAIVRAGGDVIYDYQWPDFDAKPRGPKWLRELIGIDYFNTVIFIDANTPAVDDAVVAQIGRLTRVRAIGLQGSTVTDEGLAGLANLHDLRTIHLRCENVDGSGFRHLSGLQRLTNLHFRATPITDENLAYLQPFSTIEKLSLCKTRVTNIGMKTVARLPNLRETWIEDSEVGDEGLRELGQTGRPMAVHVWPKTRLTPEGIEAMKQAAPQITVIP